MNWNYEEYVKEQIQHAVSDLSITGYTFEVCTEQIFVNMESLSPTTVYVVIKYLSSTNTLDAIEQPVQLLVFCEDNQIQVSQMVFSKFVSSNNFKEIIEGNEYIKQDYREPVVLSNFNQTAYGYRTIMYISGTLFLMEGIIDISSFTIKVGENDAEKVRPIRFNIAYSMTPNTQPVPSDKLATSVKSVATFSLSFNVPLTSKYNFITTLANIMNGSLSGNTSLELSFKLGSVKFGYFETGDAKLEMKVVSVQVTTAINEIPSIQIGLIK